MNKLTFALTGIVGLPVLDWQRGGTQNIFWRPCRRHKQCGEGLNRGFGQGAVAGVLIRDGCQPCTQLWDVPAPSIICLWIKNAFWWSSANLPKGMRVRAIGMKKISPRLVRHGWPQLFVSCSYRCMWQEEIGYIFYCLGQCFIWCNTWLFYSDLKLATYNKSEKEFLRYSSGLLWYLMSAFSSEMLASFLCFVPFPSLYFKITSS